VARTANQLRPTELLDRIADYFAAHGVADLSLRPLSKAVKSSPRVLLYYFGSKEELVLKAVARLRERQRVTYQHMKALQYQTPPEACRAIWRHMSSPQNARLFAISLEIFTRAVREPKRFADYLHGSIEDWLGFLAPPLLQKGYSESEARAYATVVVAGFRGFLLDYCATQDRARLDRAVELWLATIDALPLSLRKENVDGK
jgi:AcrR family transcriptional regulator